MKTVNLGAPLYHLKMLKQKFGYLMLKFRNLRKQTNSNYIPLIFYLFNSLGNELHSALETISKKDLECDYSNGTISSKIDAKFSQKQRMIYIQKIPTSPDNFLNTYDQAVCIKALYVNTMNLMTEKIQQITNNQFDKSSYEKELFFAIVASIFLFSSCKLTHTEHNIPVIQFQDKFDLKQQIAINKKKANSKNRILLPVKHGLIFKDYHSEFFKTMKSEVIVGNIQPKKQIFSNNDGKRNMRYFVSKPIKKIFPDTITLLNQLSDQFKKLQQAFFPLKEKNSESYTSFMFYLFNLFGANFHNGLDSSIESTKIDLEIVHNMLFRNFYTNSFFRLRYTLVDRYLDNFQDQAIKNMVGNLFKQTKKELQQKINNIIPESEYELNLLLTLLASVSLYTSFKIHNLNYCVPIIHNRSSFDSQKHISTTTNIKEGTEIIFPLAYGLYDKTNQKTVLKTYVSTKDANHQKDYDVQRQDQQQNQSDDSKSNNRKHIFHSSKTQLYQLSEKFQRLEEKFSYLKLKNELNYTLFIFYLFNLFAFEFHNKLDSLVTSGQIEANHFLKMLYEDFYHDQFFNSSTDRIDELIKIFKHDAIKQQSINMFIAMKNEIQKLTNNVIPESKYETKLFLTILASISLYASFKIHGLNYCVPVVRYGHDFDPKKHMAMGQDAKKGNKIVFPLIYGVYDKTKHETIFKIGVMVQDTHHPYDEIQNQQQQKKSPQKKQESMKKSFPKQQKQESLSLDYSDEELEEDMKQESIQMKPNNKININPAAQKNKNVLIRQYKNIDLKNASFQHKLAFSFMSQFERVYVDFQKYMFQIFIVQNGKSNDPMFIGRIEELIGVILHDILTIEIRPFIERAPMFKMFGTPYPEQYFSSILTEDIIQLFWLNGRKVILNNKYDLFMQLMNYFDFSIVQKMNHYIPSFNLNLQQVYQQNLEFFELMDRLVFFAIVMFISIQTANQNPDVPNIELIVPRPTSSFEHHKHNSNKSINSIVSYTKKIGYKMEGLDIVERKADVGLSQNFVHLDGKMVRTSDLPRLTSIN